MRAVIQRVDWARVKVKGEVVGEIGKGYLVFLGVRKGDGEKEAKKMAEKITYLRIFEDEEGKLNRSIREVGGQILLVSQFTLYADTRKGRRPSFEEVASREEALFCYRKVGECLRSMGIPLSWGEFGEVMEVELLNKGPLTIILEI